MTAKEAREQIAQDVAKQNAERERSAAYERLLMQDKINEARESVLPLLLARIESKIQMGVRDRWLYVRFPAEDWMLLPLLKEDLTRTLNGLGYGITYE